jgi:hypothetical protein
LMLVAAASWVWGEMLNNIYVVLFIKGRIVLSVWPIYTLFVFRLTRCIHNKQIIQNCSLLFVVDLNYFNNLNHGYDSDLFWKIQGISNYLLTPIKLRKHLKKFQYWTLYIGIVVNRISFQVLFFMQNCPSLVKTILGQPEKA